MNLERFFINLTAVSVPTQWQITKAKRAYKKLHPVCAVCGTTKDIEIHHIIPVHVDATKACDQDNLMSLCDWRNHGCHFVWGHFRNFRSKWNPDIVEFAESVKELRNSW